MQAVLRALGMYAFLLLLFRISGKRSLGELTMLDFLVLLVIGDTTQQALVQNDFSMTDAFIVILTLIGADLLLSFVKRFFPRLKQVLEGRPLIIVENGVPYKDRLRGERIDEEDVLEAARASWGLERMDQIKYAVLERHGGISIIPRERP